MIITKYSKVYSVLQIRNVMINSANLFYKKKIISRPKWYKNSKIQEARTLFSIKFFKILTAYTLIINMTETYVDHSKYNTHCLIGIKVNSDKTF